LGKSAYIIFQDCRANEIKRWQYCQVYQNTDHIAQMYTTTNQACALVAPGAEKARILVIRLKNVSDIMLTSVLCNSLKQTFPKARVDFLVPDHGAELFSNHPFIDQIISLSPAQLSNPFKYCSVIKKITNEGYDLVVDAQATLKSELVSLFVRKHAICIGRKSRGLGYFYTHRVEITNDLVKKADDCLKLLRPLEDMGFDVQRDQELRITVPQRLRKRYQRFMCDRGVDFSRPVFAFSVTASLDFKKWRMDYLEEVVSYCLHTFNAQVILNAGSAKERSEVRAFVERIGKHQDVYFEIETKDLMDLAALFTNCDLYIGNEGGPSHIAQAAGTPSVSIFSPSAKKCEWLPRNSREHQGVEWDDLVDSPAEEKFLTHKALEVGSKKYAELYSKITPQPVIERIDDVTHFVGIQRSD